MNRSLRHLWTLLAGAGISATLALGYTGTAHAERIKNPVAEFAGIDKITGRIITFDAYVGETVQFGALQVTPRVCYSAPDTEEPKTDSFVEVDEITLDRKIRRIFTGWMFAESPGLNAVEHPIYDVWLTDCKEPQATVAQQQDAQPKPPAPPPQQRRPAAPKQPAAPRPQQPPPSPGPLPPFQR